MLLKSVDSSFAVNIPVNQLKKQLKNKKVFSWNLPILQYTVQYVLTVGPVLVYVHELLKTMTNRSAQLQP